MTASVYTQETITSICCTCNSQYHRRRMAQTGDLLHPPLYGWSFHCSLKAGVICVLCLLTCLGVHHLFFMLKFDFILYSFVQTLINFSIIWQHDHCCLEQFWVIILILSKKHWEAPSLQREKKTPIRHHFTFRLTCYSAYSVSISDLCPQDLLWMGNSTLAE